MGDKSAIQWTNATWNPIVGCSITSPGCRLCYAMHEAARQIRCARGSKRETHYAGTVETVKGRPIWTGKVNAAPDHIWEAPLRWTKPRMIFANSMSDLFHDAVPDEWIDRAFAIMALSPQHTFQVLTKRAARMCDYFTKNPAIVARLARGIAASRGIAATDRAASAVKDDLFPLPNVWLGVSTERQHEADERIPFLLATPATVRFISAEPLLGPIDLTSLCNALGLGEGQRWLNALGVHGHAYVYEGGDTCGVPGLNWIIVGGESSRLKAEKPHPMHPDWARSLRDQCAAAGVPFFFKQWGDWAADALAYTEARPGGQCPPPSMRVGTAKAGRILDGREHNDFPSTGATP